ncbi:MAG: hypothetical protein AMXMBFR61_22120 [Fimbriimonadales bacterium]
MQNPSLGICRLIPILLLAAIATHAQQTDPIELRDASASVLLDDVYPVADFALELAIRCEKPGAVIQSGDPGLRGAIRLSITEQRVPLLEWQDGGWKSLTAAPLPSEGSAHITIRRIGNRVWMAVGDGSPVEAGMEPLLSGSPLYAGRLPGGPGLPAMVGSLEVLSHSAWAQPGSPPRPKPSADDRKQFNALIEAANKAKSDPKSADLARQAIDLAKSRFGYGTKEHAQATSTLALCLFNQKQDSEAIKVLHEAVAISEGAYGVGSIESGNDLRLLGSILTIQKRHSEAEPILLQARRIYQRARATESILYAHLLNNLGITLRDLGKLTEAEPVLREALERKEELNGKDPTDWPITASALGWCLHQQGKNQEAENLLAEALKLCERANPRDEIVIASLKNRLAEVRGEAPAVADATTNVLFDLPTYSLEPPSSMPPPLVLTNTPPVRLTPDIEIRSMTEAQYTGLVSAVVEAMRLVYGEMSPQEDLAFSAQWAPFFDHPSPEAIEYLEKLLPLLDRYLQVRGALAEAVIAFDQAQLEAATCAGLGDDEGALEAVELGRLHMEAIKSLLAELESLRQEISALGDPPDPAAQKEEARRRFKSLLDETQKLLPSFAIKPAKAKAELNKKVVLTPVGKNLPSGVQVDWQFSDGKSLTGGMEPIGRIFDKPGTYTGTATATDPKTKKLIAKATTTIIVAEKAATPGVWRLEKVEKKDDRGQTGYDFTPDVSFTDNSLKVNATTGGQGSMSGGRVLGKCNRITTVAWSIPPATIRPNEPFDIRLVLTDDVQGDIESLAGGGPGAVCGLNLYLTVDSPFVGMAPSTRKYEQDGYTHYYVAGLTVDSDKFLRIKDYRPVGGQISDEKTVKLALPPATPGARFRIQFKAEDNTWAATSGRAAQSFRHYVYVYAGEDEEIAEDPIEESLADLERKANEQQIQFHEGNIAYFRDRIRGLERQLADAKDPASRESIEWQLMCARSNIQAEEDAIQRVKTGEWIRTRTEFDAYCLQRMAAQGREMAQEWAEITRLQAAVPRLLEMLPYEQRRDLRAFVDRHLNAETMATRDMEQMRNAVRLVGERVQAHWSGEMAKEQEKADTANYCMEKAQEIKSLADNAMFVASFAGGPLIYSAYMGATGYVGGGPTKALKQGVQSLGQVGYLAVSAYDGYERSGIAGAAWDVAKAAATSFVLKRVIGSITGAMAGKSSQGVPSTRKWPTVQQQIEAARFQSEAANGRALVKLFKSRAEKLAEAGKSGASRDVIEKLRREAEDAAAAIKSSFAAKMQLNQAVRAGDAKLGNWYRSHERQINGKVKAELDAIMKREGWSPQKIREFRNASSAGRASMDMDLGAVEPPRYIIQGGKPVPNPEYAAWRQGLTQNGEPRSPHHFQEAGQKYLEEAYKKVTGRNPDQAFVNFTTSGHPEAYKDLAWLGRKGERSVFISRVDPKWASQAGEVAKFKVNELPAQHPSLGRYNTMQENCRGLVKELDSKLGNVLSSMPPAQRQYLQRLRGVMEDFATNRIGPIDADRRLQQLTGGRGLAHVADLLGSLMHASAMR